MISFTTYFGLRDFIILMIEFGVRSKLLFKIIFGITIRVGFGIKIEFNIRTCVRIASIMSGNVMAFS